MAEIIEEFFIPKHTSIVIAGTHGKTTTTAMLAWIFQVAGRRPDFLVGGVAPNFGDRSYGLGGGEEFIIEGDEYETAFFDRGPKFLHYHPDELILTSLEYDHADIYPDLASISKQFRLLVNLVPRRGRILAWGESDEVRRCAEKAFCPVETYGFSADCDWSAGDLLWEDNMTAFRVAYRGKEVARIRTPVAGRHNDSGCIGRDRISLRARSRVRGHRAGALYVSKCPQAHGIKGDAGGVTVIEDFAHHPTAIRLTLEAARTRWPGRRIWAAIEPRSNTMRRKIFEKVLPEALAVADAALIGPVSRAQLLKDEDRFSPAKVAEDVRALGRPAQAFDSAEEIAEYLAAESRPGDVVMIMSNGSFDGLSAKLLEKLAAHAGARA